MYKTLDDALKDITHVNRRKREAVVKYLSEVKDDRRADTLIGMLNDADESVRESVASALAVLKDEKAIQPLIDCFIDPARRPQPDIDGNVSTRIATCIKQFGPKSTPYLLPYLNDPVGAWQKNILWLLGEVSDPETVQPLIDAHNASESGDVRYSVKEALKKINTGPAQAFIRGLKKRW